MLYNEYNQVKLTEMPARLVRNCHPYNHTCIRHLNMAPNPPHPPLCVSCSHNPTNK